MPDTMLAEVSGNIGRVTINNPEKHNAISAEMSERGAQIIEGFTANEAVRAIVIAGAGDKAWTSGADLRKFEGGQVERSSSVVSAPFYDSIRKCPKPVIALIRGYCLGGGVALACACDLRIAETNAVFAIPAARLGGSYPPLFTRWIIDVVGIPNAKEMLYSAKRYSAVEALRMNLVNQVVGPDQLKEFSEAYVRTITSNAPLSLQASKALIEEVAAHPTDWDSDYCLEFTDRCRLSEDFKEGRLAFAEKRSPVFLGK
jgi:enoyl-CoA hydratase